MEIKIENHTKAHVKIDKRDDGSIVVKVSDPELKRLFQVEPGTTIRIGNREYIVLCHDGYTTTVITKGSVSRMEFGDDSNFAHSKIYEWLNEVFYQELEQVTGPHVIRSFCSTLLAEDGTNEGKSVSVFVSLPTTHFYRKYRRFLNPIGTEWWTMTPATCVAGDWWNRHVCCVYEDGTIGYRDSTYPCEVRPVLHLDSCYMGFQIVED